MREGHVPTFIGICGPKKNPCPISTLPAPQERTLRLRTFGPHNLHETRHGRVAVRTRRFRYLHVAGVRVFVSRTHSRPRKSLRLLPRPEADDPRRTRSRAKSAISWSPPMGCVRHGLDRRLESTAIRSCEISSSTSGRRPRVIKRPHRLNPSITSASRAWRVDIPGLCVAGCARETRVPFDVQMVATRSFSRRTHVLSGSRPSR